MTTCRTGQSRYPWEKKKSFTLHGASDDPLHDTRLKQISHIKHIWSQGGHAPLSGSITEVLKLWYMYHQWGLIFYTFITFFTCVIDYLVFCSGIIVYITCLQPFYDGEPKPLLWARAQAASRQVTVSGIPNCLNYCANVVVYHNLDMWSRAAGWRPML